MIKEVINVDFKGKIYVSTTGTVITPYEKGQCKYLENVTSKYNRAFFRRDEITGYYIDDDDSLKEPCFITHLFGTQFLQNLFLQYEIVKLPSKKGKKLGQFFTLNSDITPTDIQYRVINEIITTHKDKHQWFVHLTQGYGKTLLSVYLISHFQVKTLVMCYSVDILNQWIDTFARNTTMDVRRVLLIDDSQILNDIYKKRFPVDAYDIFMCTPGILVGYCKKHGFARLPIILDRMGIGFKIFDEAHRNIANIIKINAFTSIDKTLYLSGDFGQSDKDKQRMYFNMFRSVPVITPPDEVMEDLKYTVAIVVEYNSEPSVKDIASVYTKQGFSFYNYMKYQFTKKIFFDVLDFVLQNIFKTNTGYRILILVNLINHCDQLYEIVKEKYGDNHTVGRFHGDIPQEEKSFAKDRAEIIVATYQSFSTGINTSSIKYVISTSVCTKIDDNQASGRARPMPDGSDAYYFMFCDTGFDYSLKKLKDRLNYLKKVKIKKIQKIKYV